MSDPSNPSGAPAGSTEALHVRPLPTPTRRQLAQRGGQLAFSAARRLAPLAAARARRRPVTLADAAPRLRLVADDMGGAWSKLGQLVGSSPGLLGDVLSEAFRGCLDAAAPVPFPAVRAVVERDLGRPLDATFSTFEQTPMAAASVAVVHRATLLDGTPVAVKVIRPDVERAMAADLGVMEPALRAFVRYGGFYEARILLDVASGLREQFAEELDVRNELVAMEQGRALLAAGGLGEQVVVPLPYPEHSGRRVLTMELLDGIPIDDLAAIEQLGVDPRPMVEALVRWWFVSALTQGVFHGDVHAGNLLLLSDGRMGVLDWGIVGRLDGATLAFFRATIRGCLGDDDAWLEVVDHLIGVYGPALAEGLGMTREQLVELARSQLEPVLTQPFGQANLGAFVWGTSAPGSVTTPFGPVASSEVVAAVPVGRIRRAVNMGRRWRARRRFQATFLASEGSGSTFDRATFLLSKQLVYFERYGKLFLADVPLLADRELLAPLVGLPLTPPADERPAV